MNPYDAPHAGSDPARDRVAEEPIHPAIRVFSGLAACSGAVFVPAALFPLLTPGLFVWIGWLLIAFGMRWWDSRLFWWFSLGWNIFTFWFLIILRGGAFGPLDAGMAFVWTHLLTMITGSGTVLVCKYEAARTDGSQH